MYILDLFDQDSAELANILPKDGVACYFGKVFSEEDAERYFNYLLHSIEWKNDEAYIFSKHYITDRKVAWYGDQPFKYTYSKATKTALPWTPELLELKHTTEQRSNESYNSCLLNLYHNGSEGMAWHSDGERALKKNAAIASLTFGAERKFSFKHKKTKETVSINLESGSMLVMKDVTQEFWLHRLPPTKLPKGPRINLTFRTIEA